MMGIKLKLLTPVTISIIVVAAAILISNIILFSGFVDETTVEAVEAATRVAVKNIEFLKNDAGIASSSVSKDQSIINAIEEGNQDKLITRALQLRRQTGVDFITITDASGVVLARTHALEQFGDSVITQANVASALKGESLTTIEQGAVILLSVRAGAPVYGDGGNIIGVISAGFRLDSEAFVDSIKEMMGCETTIVLGDERIATTVLNDDGERAVGTRADARIVGIVKTGEAYSGRVDILGKEAICHYTPIFGPDDAVIGMMFIGRYIKSATDTILTFVQGGVVIALISLAAAIAVFLLIIGKIAKPLQAIKVMLDATPLASRLWDKDYNIIECNEAAVKLFGLKNKQEYINRYFELAPEYQSDGQTTKEKARNLVRETFEKGSARCDELVYLLPDGTPLPAEVTLTRVPYEDGYVAASYSRDLREQKKMIADIETRERLLQTVNQAAYLLLRSKPSIFTNTLQESMQMIAEAVGAERTHIYKNHTDGEGRLYGTQLHIWPESEAMEADAVIYEDNTPNIKDMLMQAQVIHTRTELLPSPDREWMQALGVKILLMVPVFIHNSFWGFVSFDKRHTDEMFSAAEEAIVQPGSLLIANALLRNEYVQSIHDASEELEAALNTAEKANSAKSDFLASMSHEMRTPLNAVIGLSEIALDTENLSREAKLNLENIYTSGLTLLNIVNDILDVSKIQSGKFEIVPAQYDVPSMVNDAIIQNVMRIGSKPIRFILNIKANMYARLYGDELRIKQVINNLLSNAIKYTEKGLVMLDIDRERDGETVWLTIRVSDTGVGIKKENMKDLFVDFAQFGATAKQQAGGTGLGLSITKSLAEMMGGGITVESTYGEGSEFTVRITQKHVNDQTIGAAVAESLIGFQYSAVKRSSNTRRVQLPYASVLLVDDNVTNLEVAKGLLKPYRMKVDTVTSGRAAINLIREEGQRYNAIFMDHMMPEMDGIEALEHIREIGTEYARAIPIIALTANAIAGNEELFIAKGFQAFISKPIDINKLDAVINRFVRDKETERELLDQEQELNAPRLPEAAKLIGSLDTWEALSRCNWDEEVLTDILKSFASNTPEQLHKLDAYLEAGSLNDYAIVVHGIKGTSYAICAQAAGREAEALEVMAKKGDMLGVRSAHQSFVKTIGTLVGEINKAFAKSPKPAGASSKPDKYGFTAPDAEILIVEDNETNVKVAQGLLKPLEMRIDVAENGSVALRMIQNKEYDIIFMDHLMPVMDGIEATKRIRRLEGGYYQNVPVIALSAASESDVKAAFTQAGMNDFISKPIDITEICRKIKLWLPPSLVRETAPVMGVTVADEELPVIEGIDAGEGIRLLNSKEVFFNLLGDFYKLIDMKSARIKQYLDDGLIRDLTIEVHALKNTARLIGATALSDEFYQMEKYGDSGDILALEREIPGVLERYRSYKPILKPYGEAAEDGKRAATAGELTALLEKVKNSMDCFDLDAADGALKELDALQFPPECRGQMEDLRAYMADVAMEDVMKLADEMINAINAMGE